MDLLPSRWLRSRSLGATISLIVFAGALVPLVIGLVRLDGAAGAGETLVRENLHALLSRDTASVRARWEYRYSDLLLLSQDPAALLVLSQSTQTRDSAQRQLAGLFSDTHGIERVVYFDETGQRRSNLGTPEPTPDAGSRNPAGESLLRVDLPIVDAARVKRGELHAWVQLGSLLPADADGTSDAPVRAVVERGDGRLLQRSELAVTMISSRRFQWNDQEWVSERVSVADPAIDIVIAAPIDRFVRPFQRARIEGALALLAGTALALILAAFLTRRITGSLGRVTGAAEAIAGGDLERRVEDGGTAEIGRLGRAFNTMCDSLRRTIDELARREALATVGEFAAQLAHEIRNPLTAIRIDLQRLRRLDPVDNERDETIARALRQVERLDQAVGGALSITQSARFARELVALNDVLTGARRTAAPFFAARNAQLQWEQSQSAAIRITGDEAALERVFANLFINAAQALNPGGQATVNVREVDAGVEIVVADNGAGMPPEVLARAFEPFFTTKAEGTGLGLVISRRIVDAHGGHLAVESSSADGTKVLVSLPTIYSRPAPPSSAAMSARQ